MNDLAEKVLVVELRKFAVSKIFSSGSLEGCIEGIVHSEGRVTCKFSFTFGAVSDLSLSDTKIFDGSDPEIIHSNLRKRLREWAAVADIIPNAFRYQLMQTIWQKPSLIEGLASLGADTP